MRRVCCPIRCRSSLQWNARKERTLSSPSALNIVHRHALGNEQCIVQRAIGVSLDSYWLNFTLFRKHSTVRLVLTTTSRCQLRYGCISSTICRHSTSSKPLLRSGMVVRNRWCYLELLRSRPAEGLMRKWRRFLARPTTSSSYERSLSTTRWLLRRFIVTGQEWYSLFLWRRSPSDCWSTKQNILTRTLLPTIYSNLCLLAAAYDASIYSLDILI